MKVKVVKPVDLDLKYLKAKFGVRYWVDCKYSKDNGQTWIDSDDDSEEADAAVVTDMPFVVPEKDRWGTTNYWVITIDLDEGKVINWPKDFMISTNFKVCDDGEYIFLDENKNELINITKEYDQYYVPDFLALEDDGYGDYVYLDIDSEGNINNADLMRERIVDYFNEMSNND